MTTSSDPGLPAAASRRALRGIILGFAISAVGFGAMTPFLVIWAHHDAGLTGSAAGLLFVAQAAGELSGGLAGGMLADRLGARQVLIVSTIGMALAYGSLALVSAPAPAIAVMYVAGVFEAAYHPTALALVGDLVPEAERTRAYGLVRAGANVGTILGPLAGAALVAGAPVADVFGLAGGLLGVAGLVACLTLPRRGPAVDLAEEAEEVRDALPGLAAIGRDRRLGLLVIAGALTAITLTWWEADGWAILHTQRTFTITDFSLLLALDAALTVVFQLPVSRLVSRRSGAVQFGGGITMQAIGLVLLADASSGVGLVVAAVTMMSLGQMVSSPQVSALAARLAPRGAGATYQAAVSMTLDVGQAAGPASGLALGSSLGGATLWLVALPLCAGAALAAVRASRDPDSDPGPAGPCQDTGAPMGRKLDRNPPAGAQQSAQRADKIDDRGDHLVQAQPGGVQLDGVVGGAQG